METLENKDTITQPNDQILDQVLEFRDRSHAENVRKLKAGIKCIFTVPACFLVLMFFTGTSKIIFLVLWIVSLFLIAAYLIHVEYSDYKIQEMVNSLQDSDEEINSLIDIEQIHSKVSAPKKKLDDIIADVRNGIQAQTDTLNTEDDTDENSENAAVVESPEDTTADTDDICPSEDRSADTEEVCPPEDMSADTGDITSSESIIAGTDSMDPDEIITDDADDDIPPENISLPESDNPAESISPQERPGASDASSDPDTSEYTTNTTEEVSKS